MRTTKIVLPILAVIALAGLGMGIWAKASQPTSLTREAKDLKGQLATAKREISVLQGDSQDSAVSSLRNQLHLYKICIPEIQQEISGMSIQQQTQGGYVTNAYITNPTIISSDCNKALNG